jgi:hypothetical protein
MKSLISLLAAVPFVLAQTVSNPEQGDEIGVELKLAAILKTLEEIRTLLKELVARDRGAGETHHSPDRL